VIEHELDRERAVLYLRPKSALSAEDFAELAGEVDPFLEQTHGALAGIVLEVASFPGWDSLSALMAHLRFVRDHHRRVRKVAVVTDSALGDLAERLASHFVAAKIRHFRADELDAARRWVLERN